jgi:hypothetical protein
MLWCGRQVKMCPTRRRRVSPTIIETCWAHFHLLAIPDHGGQKVNKFLIFSYVHKMSMLYTWTYLMYLHIYVSSAYSLWIVQTMALRLVGLAFEVNSTLKSTKSLNSLRAPMGDNVGDQLEPSAVDIIAYSYFFIGLHRGIFIHYT